MENLRISTITCVAELNTHTDLDLFYKHIDIDDKVKYIEKGDLPPRGEPTKKKRKSRSSKKNTVFFNQVTIHYFHEKMINIKIFNNGKIVIAITITPIPPNHCKIDLHIRILFGVSSKLVIIVEPVVVMPDMLSKKASI